MFQAGVKGMSERSELIPCTVYLCIHSAVVNKNKYNVMYLAAVHCNCSAVVNKNKYNVMYLAVVHCNCTYVLLVYMHVYYSDMKHMYTFNS